MFDERVQVVRSGEHSVGQQFQGWHGEFVRDRSDINVSRFAAGGRWHEIAGQQVHPQLEGAQHFGPGPLVRGRPDLPGVHGRPQVGLGVLDQQVPHSVGERPALGDRLDQVRHQRAELRCPGQQLHQVTGFQVRRRVLRQVIDAVAGVGVAGLAQSVLRPEMVNHQCRGNTGIGGDRADRGRLEAVPAEVHDRGVPDSGARRQVVNRLAS